MFLFKKFVFFVILSLGIVIGLSDVAKSEQVCKVADPTGTPLNVRETPNGRVINALRQNREVSIIQIDFDNKAQSWALVGGYYQGKYRVWGWVFREFINCPYNPNEPDRRSNCQREGGHWSGSSDIGTVEDCSIP
jgi:hypothetical protein